MHLWRRIRTPEALDISESRWKLHELEVVRDDLRARERARFREPLEVGDVGKRLRVCPAGSRLVRRGTKVESGPEKLNCVPLLAGASEKFTGPASLPSTTMMCDSDWKPAFDA